jgi:hypothetical protein
MNEIEEIAEVTVHRIGHREGVPVSSDVERRTEPDDAPTALTWTEDGRLLASVATPLDSNGEAGRIVPLQ